MSVLPFHLLPETSEVDASGRLSVGGCELSALAAEHGTPLFVYDEAHLRARCREAVAAFPDGVAYATKAFLCGAMARLALDEGLLLDVATGGEIHVSLAAGVPADRLVFHGNNKSPNELRKALEAGVGRIVIDSLVEMDRIEALVTAGAPRPTVLIRINPGIEAHTHEYLRTGGADSKFGITTEGGEAERAVARARVSSAMDLIGIHAHVGSQVFDVASFERAIEIIAGFAAPLDIEELSIGGGLGVAYVEGETAPTITDWGKAVIDAAHASGVQARIMAEPGRAIVAQAALTLYTVGIIKEIAGIRTYVSVDGGMSDNPLSGALWQRLRGIRPDGHHRRPHPTNPAGGQALRIGGCAGTGRNHPRDGEGRRSARHPGDRGLWPFDGLELQHGSPPGGGFRGRRRRPPRGQAGDRRRPSRPRPGGRPRLVVKVSGPG